MVQLFLLMPFLISSISWAQKTYTIGVEDIDLSPIYSTKAPNYKYEGYVHEVLERFAKDEKIAFKYISLPNKRMRSEYYLGKIDFSFPDNLEWNVEQKSKYKFKIKYSNPVLTFQDAVFVQPNRLGLGIDKLKSLGMIMGYSYWKFQPLVESGKMKIETSPSPETLIQMVLHGRVDGINLARQVANYHLQKMGLKDQLVFDPQLMPIKDSHYYLSTIRYPEIIEKFNTFLKTNHQFINQLKKKNGLDY